MYSHVHLLPTTCMHCATRAPVLMLNFQCTESKQLYAIFFFSIHTCTARHYTARLVQIPIAIIIRPSISKLKLTRYSRALSPLLLSCPLPHSPSNLNHLTSNHLTSNQLPQNSHSETTSPLTLVSTPVSTTHPAVHLLYI